ncbi:DUF4224 domain-containing protein [Herbaspirillum sp. AP02]|uniref:DUF4224 domain-containing protein n=1 Tax=unclassified Herbaspirillum TaxID=2624150 RepID=UPI0015DA1047|nr:DUF4224 domain-containing protein [Herbaspirillum sp. AP02]NZD66649.1 DUF4224 domain-containing protein [Herbaspirillum sp. AP21]
MISEYLSAAELASLIGCRPNSLACMKRWLTKNGWPYVENIRGFPQVWRRYHDARMSGEADLGEVPSRTEPDFAALCRFEQPL